MLDGDWEVTKKTLLKSGYIKNLGVGVLFFFLKNNPSNYSLF